MTVRYKMIASSIYSILNYKLMRLVSILRLNEEYKRNGKNTKLKKKREKSRVKSHSRMKFSAKAFRTWFNSLTKIGFSFF